MTLDQIHIHQIGLVILTIPVDSTTVIGVDLDNISNLQNKKFVFYLNLILNKKLSLELKFKKSEEEEQK